VTSITGTGEAAGTSGIDVFGTGFHGYPTPDDDCNKDCQDRYGRLTANAKVSMRT